MNVRVLAPAGSTGNVTLPAGSGLQAKPLGAVALQFVVEAVGATPTVTFKYQGSVDGVNWFDVPYLTPASDTLSQATTVVTAVGATLLWVDRALERSFKFFRVVTTANTNVTFRAELYALN
jgi:hypothetical protein